MSLFDRRSCLTSLLAITALSGCRFEPALQEERGALSPLYGQVEIREPGSSLDFVMTRQLEDRLGRGGPTAPFQLLYGLDISSNSLGTDSEGVGQRVHLDGRANYRLVRRGEVGALAQGTVAQFTGYSVTGNTVTTSAAERAANERLVVMLANGVFERLLLASPDLPL